MSKRYTGPTVAMLAADAAYRKALGVTSDRLPSRIGTVAHDGPQPSRRATVIR